MQLFQEWLSKWYYFVWKLGPWKYLCKDIMIYICPYFIVPKVKVYNFTVCLFKFHMLWIKTKTKQYHLYAGLAGLPGDTGEPGFPGRPGPKGYEGEFGRNGLQGDKVTFAMCFIPKTSYNGTKCFLA